MEEVDPRLTNCEVFVQVIDNNECADAECDIGGHVVEPDGKEKGTKDEDMRKREDRVSAEHLQGWPKGKGAGTPRAEKGAIR